MINEGSRQSLILLLLIATIMLLSSDFGFSKFLSGDFSWKMSIYSIIFFVCGAYNAGKSWKRADEEYQDAIEERKTRALAQAQPSPVSSQPGRIPTHVGRP